MGQVWRMAVHLAVPPSYFEKERPIDYDRGNQGDVSGPVDGKEFKATGHQYTQCR